MHSVSEKCVDHKSFMMHANACCTCNPWLLNCNFFSRTHYSDNFTNASLQYSQNRNTNHLKYIMLKMPVHSCRCQSRMGYYSHIYMLGNNGHTRCAYTPTWIEVFYITIAFMWLHACQYIACQDVHYSKRF